MKTNEDPQWTQIKLKNKVFWWFKGHTMFGFSVFSFHFLLSCFMLLVSSSPGPRSCGYLGEIPFPFTKSSEPKSGLQINGCDQDFGADKNISLTDHNSCIIDRIFYIPNSELDYLSIFVRCSDFDVTFAPEQLKKPFKIVNNTTFTGCFRNSYDNESPKMFLYRHCRYLDIYFNSSSALDYSLPMPILPFPCLLFEFLHTNYSTCPSYTFLFSVLEIKLEIDENCTQCLPPLCQIQFEEGQRLSCVRYHHEESHTIPSSSPPHPLPATSKAKKIGLYVGIPILVAAVIIGLAVILLLCKGRKIYSGLQKESRRAASVSFRNTTTRESGGVYFGIPVFSYEELQEATNNFDQARELGQGGFGTVYYGTLRDGREVAVKRLFERNYRPVESFINEIQILKRLRHRNLVSLYGCTSRHSRELLLVYEYIPNGTVSSHLYGEQANPSFLPWPLRMKIAIETASALAYLHASDIIHRDVKTSNILLDSEFGVKVSDFGLSRLFPDDVTHVSTAPKGTPGYVDPDYGLCYQLTTKSDVYSFGVVLVELISSLKAVDINRNREDIKLANLAIRKIQKGAFYELVDPSLGFQSDEKLKSMICSVAELAFQCLQGDKELRPSMGEVLEVLERIHSGRDEPPNQKEIVVHGATRASQSYAHPPLPKTLMSTQQHLHKTY